MKKKIEFSSEVSLFFFSFARERDRHLLSFFFYDQPEAVETEASLERGPAREGWGKWEKENPARAR